MDLQAFEIGSVKEINQAREENRCPSIYYTASQHSEHVCYCEYLIHSSKIMLLIC